MTRWQVAAVAVAAAIGTAGCARSPRLVLDAYVNDQHGFTLSKPSGWHRVESDEGRRVWFVSTAPAAGVAPEGEATEFIVVMSQPADGPVPEPEVRRLAMTLLPMHGVSGFQRTDASTESLVWYRFELTGSTRGIEWASLGLLVSGPRRLHYLVCAAPLGAWRERQKLCEEVLRSFTPGDLAK